MPAVARRTPWASQPGASAVVSRASPLSRGLLLFAPGSQMTSAAVIDLQQLANGTFRGGSGPIVVPGSRAVSFDGAFDSGGINWGTGASLKSSSFTWTGIFHFTSFSTPYCPIFFWSTPSDSYTLFVKNDGKLASYCSRNSVSAFYDGNGANVIQTGAAYRLTLAAAEGGPFRAYVNGTLDGATNVAAGGFTVSNGTVWINHEDVNINEKWAGWARDFAYWNRELSAAEIAELNARPHQLFAPLTRRFVAGIPRLSGAAAIDITAVSARPRVTITF